MTHGVLKNKNITKIAHCIVIQCAIFGRYTTTILSPK